MKNLIIKLLSVSVILISFNSCRDFLEKEPLTEFKTEEVFNSVDGIEAAVNGMYLTMSDYNYYGAAWHGLVNPHSGRMWSFQNVTSDATGLNCGTENRWLVEMWPQMYKTIGTANRIIANVENTNFSNRDVALGQAYFIRGVVYFDLVRLFGGVPLRLKPVTEDDLFIGKSSKEDVYKQIIKDFTIAKQLLPDAGKYKKDRPVKWAAYGYLAKVYMQLAGEDGGDPANWQKAWDEAIQVYGKYSLVSNYASLFSTTNENTTESIFEIQYGHFGVTRTSDVARMYMPPNSPLIDPVNPTRFNTFGWIMANKETYDQHIAQYSNDPRIAVTYLADSYQRFNTNTNKYVTQNLYPKNAKGRYGRVYIQKMFDASYNGNTVERNLMVFRYADLLLMLAEIRNEIDGGPANAYQYVNLVLDRARKSATVVPPVGTLQQPVDYTGMTQAQFRDRIMQERKYELLAEGQDWFDARRRGYQYFLDKTVLLHNSHPKIDLVTDINDGGDYQYPVLQRNMLLPIPQTEITANPKMSQSDQNPGY